MKRIVISLDHLESKLFIRYANHLDLSWVCFTLEEARPLGKKLIGVGHNLDKTKAHTKTHERVKRWILYHLGII